MWSLYKHTSPSGKVYIGITSQNPKYRWKANGVGYLDSPYFYKAIQKYGWDNIQHEILFENLSETDAKKLEVDLIAHYKSLNKSYNISSGGDGCSGYKHTEEARIKIRERMIGNIPWNKGIPRTPEEKLKMSLSHKGKTQTKESNKKRSETLKGRIISEEVRIKIANALKGKPKSEEHKRKMSQAQMGKKHTQESKQKMSESRMGKEKTKEFKRKMSTTSNQRVMFIRNGIRKWVHVQDIHDVLKEGWLPTKNSIKTLNNKFGIVI